MSTSAINPGIQTLLETLGNQSPALATPAVQSAIQNASPTDIVQLSDAALKAQTVSELFAPAVSTSTADPASVIAGFIQSLTQSGASPTNTTPQSLDAALQQEQVQGLFGASGLTA